MHPVGTVLPTTRASLPSWPRVPRLSELSCTKASNVIAREDLPSDHPLPVFGLKDTNPSQLSNVLTPNLHQCVGGDAHHLLLLLVTPDALDDMDINQRHTTSFRCFRVRCFRVRYQTSGEDGRSSPIGTDGVTGGVTTGKPTEDESPQYRGGTRVLAVIDAGHLAGSVEAGNRDIIMSQYPTVDIGAKPTK